MNRTHMTPVHPGEVLKDELEGIELIQTALTNHIEEMPKTINRMWCHPVSSINVS